MYFSLNKPIVYLQNQKKVYPGQITSVQSDQSLENTVNVIDLFAGPGGLGEGFFSYRLENHYPFNNLISVEKDTHAHATLTLRAFYRLLIKHNKSLPEEYYLYAIGKAQSPANDDTEELWQEAQNETLKLELGKDPASDSALFEELVSQLEKSENTAPTLLIGGPPCQAYSLVGRARNKGNKDYVPEEDNRHFLYKEYLNIMNRFSPDLFVMENVKGLLSSKVNGGTVFTQIVKDLESCGDGYSLFSLKTGKQFQLGNTDPSDFILCSEDYGVPQNRHRVIILGIKKTSRFIESKVTPIPYCQTVTVKDAIGDLPPLRSPISNRGSIYKIDSLENWKKNITDGINILINSSKLEKRLANNLKFNLMKITNSNLHTSNEAEYSYDNNSSEYSSFVKDSAKLKITSHEARPHMDSDLLRYFYCATYRETYGKNARSDDFPVQLAPAHKSWDSGKFVDRFKVQSYKTTSSTITSHISKDGHYFIHSTPEQCRSITVREAARLQSFPDSYQFMGKRTNQYHQVGNAVPPLLARKIAKIIYSMINQGHQ